MINQENPVPIGAENKLPNQLVVAVSGVASGIGLAQAERFLREGHYVYGIDLQETSAALNLKSNEPERFNFVLGDISKETVVKDFLKRINESWGSLHVLCNTAGQLDGYRNIEETSSDEFTSYFENNVLSQFLMTKYALPLLLKNESSRIINMSSIAGVTAGGGGISYTAAKHAICGLTKQMAYDYSDQGLRINAIAPGAIATEMNRSDFEEEDGKMARWVAKETPVKRWATAEEVADLSYFLASNQADYIQGAVIPIDGGWLNR